MNYQQPIQRILCFECANAGRKLLVAAAGSKIYVSDAATGSRLSSWPSSPEILSPANDNPQDSISEPPGKRRKLTSPPTGSDEAAKNTNGDRSGSSKKPDARKPPGDSIPILAVTSTGNHVVAVTAEDKCVRVFEILRDGALSQLTPR
jgi:tRNA (guanine-N(7)-)-methyltransferase subunit TRM82